MALDRQRILGELGSVMKQLQNADCGCLGKIFGDSQQTTAPTMGSPLPTCGGCRRACCHGHGRSQCNSPTRMNQAAPSMNYMPTEGFNSSQQPAPGNMYGFGPQIVNMMRGDHSRSQNLPEQPSQLYGQTQGQLTGPMVIDAPQSPHGKVGLTPFAPPSMVPQGQVMNQGDVAGQINNQYIPQSNAANMSPWSQQNINTNSEANGMSTQISPWQQQNVISQPATHQIPTSHNVSHGQHSEGIAKFNKMFPGVKQGMGGDLGFDPMAIAIQMNPDNHLQSAMSTMNKIMSGGNKGLDQMRNQTSVPPGLPGNSLNEISPIETMKQNAVPIQGAQNITGQIANQQPTGHNVITDQALLNQQCLNTYGQPIPQQSQQIYKAAGDTNIINPQIRYDEHRQLPGQQYYGEQIVDLNSTVPNLPVIQHGETVEDNQFVASRPDDTGYPSQAPAQRIIKEPIFPVDTSKNLTYMSTKQQKNSNYGYNTLGQPVEMLPAKMYHPPEPSLPQTLSPQPDPVKPKSNPPRVVNVKATVSKTSLMGNKQVGRTPSRAQLQHIYNQYKGSQSFTQQNVRQPGEGTCSDGRLNVPLIKVSPVPVERIGGDTAVNNTPISQNPINKVEQVMGAIGDVPAAKPIGESLHLKEAPTPIRKCRNGLQDMVFSSYPTSAAWTFHGHGRNDHLPVQRFRQRHY